MTTIRWANWLSGKQEEMTVATADLLETLKRERRIMGIITLTGEVQMQDSKLNLIDALEA